MDEENFFKIAVPTPPLLETPKIRKRTKTKFQILDGSFFKHIPEKSTPKKDVGLCMKCWPVRTEIQGHNNSTSNFLSHLKRKHGISCYQDCKDYLNNDDTKINVAEYTEQSEQFEPIAEKRTKLDMHPKHKLAWLDGSFFEYVPDSSTQTTIVAICMKCFPHIVEIKGFNNSSSNFISHIKRIHGNDCLEEFKSYIKSKRHKDTHMSNSDSLEESNFEDVSYSNITMPVVVNYADDSLRDEKNGNIIKFFINSMISLKHIEDKYFLQLFENIYVHDQNLEIPSKSALQALINAHYQDQIIDIKSAIRNIKHVCIVLETWACGKYTIVGTTLHWINSDLSRKSFAFTCQIFKNVCDDDILKTLQDLKDEFELNADKMATTIYKNHKKSRKSFKIEVENIEEDSVNNKTDFDADHFLIPKNVEMLTQFETFAQTLSTCIKEISQLILNDQSSLGSTHTLIIDKCTENQLNAAKIIVNVLKYPLVLIEENKWHNSLKSVKHMLTLENRNDQTEHKSEINLTDADCEYINEYIMCVDTIVEALNVLNSAENMYLGILIPCLFTLRKRINKLENKVLKHCSTLATELMKVIEAKFSDYFNLSSPSAENAAIAAMSYPRFRNNWLLCIDVDKQVHMKNVFKSIISREISKNEELIDMADIKMETFEENKFFEFDSDSDNENPSTTKSTSNLLVKAELLMLKFFSEESRDFQIFRRYPEIERIFLKYNTPLPSAAPVESLFSSITNELKAIIESQDELVEKRIVLKYNYRF